VAGLVWYLALAFGRDQAQAAVVRRSRSRRLAGIAVAAHSICERLGAVREARRRCSAAVWPRTNGGLSAV